MKGDKLVKLIPIVMLGLFLVSTIIQAMKRRENTESDSNIKPEATIAPDVDLSAPASLQHNSSHIRQQAVVTLGESHNPEVIPDLLDVLEFDHDYSTAEQAGNMLVGFGAQIVPHLLQVLQSERGDTREITAQTLGQIGDPAAIEGLSTALSDISMWVRKAAAEALGQIGDPSAIPALTRALYDDDPAVQDSAENALRRIGTPSALTAIEDSYEDEES